MTSRSVKAKERQLKLTQNINDGIEYKILKRKNINAVDVINNIKNEREKQNEKHLEFLKLKDEYDKLDSKEYPAWILCESSVVEFYKLTNDILMNILSLDKLDERIQFLQDSSDKGEFYFKVRDRLINKSDLIVYQNLKNELLDYLYKLFKDLFTENHYNTFLFCKNVLNEPKKNKKKLYIIKNNIQLLEDETGINISKFFSVNWNLPELYIPIKRSQQRKLKGIDFEFDLRIDKISEYSNKIIQEDKYIYQTLNKIKFKTISIITGEKNQENSSYKQNCDDNLKKKWSELTIEQKIDRFKDYCNHFIINKVFLNSIKEELETLKEKNNITTSFNFENENTLINKLYNLLVENHNNGHLKYKQIKWNVKNGIIEYIQNIKLQIEIQNDINIIINPTFILQNETLKKKKISSSKSILSLKSNIEYINDMLLKYIFNILINHDNEDFDDLKELHLEKSIELIKSKLKLNKITISDKEYICKQYNIFFDEILEEINKN
jgi:hypothetical protein